MDRRHRPSSDFRGPLVKAGWGLPHSSDTGRMIRISSATTSILERKAFMAKEYYLIVQAAGRQLDLLRGEASRVAKGSKVDWWIDRADVGMRFCFEDAQA